MKATMATEFLFPPHISLSSALFSNSCRLLSFSIYTKSLSPERVKQRHGDPPRKDEAICISNYKEMTTDSPK